jgi:hypothetical protein
MLGVPRAWKRTQVTMRGEPAFSASAPDSSFEPIVPGVSESQK